MRYGIEKGLRAVYLQRHHYTIIVEVRMAESSGLQGTGPITWEA